MFGAATAYVVAFSMLLFCGLSALALIRTVSHLDPPEAPELPDQVREHVTV